MTPSLRGAEAHSADRADVPEMVELPTDAFGESATFRWIMPDDDARAASACALHRPAPSRPPRPARLRARERMTMPHQVLPPTGNVAPRAVRAVVGASQRTIASMIPTGMLTMSRTMRAR